MQRLTAIFSLLTRATARQRRTSLAARQSALGAGGPALVAGTPTLVAGRQGRCCPVPRWAGRMLQGTSDRRAGGSDDRTLAHSPWPVRDLAQRGPDHPGTRRGHRAGRIRRAVARWLA